MFRKRKLALIICENKEEILINYISLLYLKIPMILVDKKLKTEEFNSLVNSYKPSYIVSSESQSRKKLDKYEIIYKKKNNFIYSNQKKFLTKLVKTSAC